MDAADLLPPAQCMPPVAGKLGSSLAKRAFAADRSAQPKPSLHSQSKTGYRPMPDASRGPEPRQLDVAIVGGGLAGLFAIWRLRGLGFRVPASAPGSGVGGRGFWTRYPGARWDVEGLESSSSFCNELQQEWQWPEPPPGWRSQTHVPPTP